MGPQEMLEELKEKGFKLTPQRMEIVKTLHDSMGDHPSLNSLYDEVKKKMPTVSFSTLYNTLSTLEKSGLIRLFDHGGETRVEMNLEDHLNLIDMKTGEIFDIDDRDVLKKLVTEIDNGKIKGKKVLVNVLLFDQDRNSRQIDPGISRKLKK